MNFGEWIRKLRMEKGLTQKEAASRLKLSPSRLAEIEAGVTYARGRPTRPSRELLARMASVYELQETVLLAEAGFPIENEPEMPQQTRQAMVLFDALPDESRRLVLAFMRMLLSEGNDIFRDK